MLSENFKWNVIKSYFDKNGFINHQIATFNDFINSGIERIIKEGEIVITPKNQKFRYSVTFDDVYIPFPTITEDDRKVKKLYPCEARIKDLNYESSIFVNITEVYQNLVGDPATDPPEVTVHRRIKIAKFIYRTIPNRARCLIMIQFYKRLKTALISRT